MSNAQSAVIGPDEEIKVTKIETFVLKNSWVFVKVSTDAGISGWGEMLKDDARACAAGALEVADYLVGKDPLQIESAITAHLRKLFGLGRIIAIGHDTDHPIARADGEQHLGKVRRQADDASGRLNQGHRAAEIVPDLYFGPHRFHVEEHDAN